ncbi:uncharacterized protein LOC135701706 [Ochlerotatus camptorhynchus]|uniref:uncharacterized protein LOC135701706 n=1 Tax=Ochlerotatus camptorhynchus TaxID=644619 RepID=UPI0031E2FA65
MPCMKMCCFQFSTRLGSIIVGISSMLQVLIPAIVLIGVGGADRLKIVASDMNDHINDFGQDAIFIWLLNFTYSDPKGIFLGTVLFCGIHALCCVLMIIGAIKFQKYLLTPFIFMDFLRLCILSLTHVIGMMVIKKQLNLGDLIAITIAGGFGLLLLFYLWACVVALYQILGIVKTEKYRKLFGNDPISRNNISTANDENTTNLQPTVTTKDKYFTYNSNFSNEYSKDNVHEYTN